MAKSDTAFLAYAMHQIPDDHLLSHAMQSVRWSRRAAALLAYQPTWLSENAAILKGKRAKALSLAENDPCLVILNSSCLFMPMQRHFVSDDMPYGLCYSFYLSQLKEHYAIVASYNGFSLVTLPRQDFKRSLRAQNQSKPADALLYLDRAIISLADHAPHVSSELERQYGKFAKLRNLFIDQFDSPEGKLAFERAMQFGVRCYELLQGESHV